MEHNVDIQKLNEKIAKESSIVNLLSMEIGKVIVGQKHLTKSLIVALLSDGHILLEGVPGLAKTLAISTLSNSINTDFCRIQFTPDLLPADLLGTMIYSQKKEEFIIKKGPIFSNLILADEVNRAPAKVQSALLEAMQERQISIDQTTYKLDAPFMVMATQNPIEQEGTYPLPEAQVDRFMLKVIITYPKKEEEKTIIERNLLKKFPSTSPVLLPKDILKARDVVKDVYMDEKIQKYIIDIVFSTRYPEQYELEKFKNIISFGGSPRASINLGITAKTNAFMNQRGYVIPEDVRAMAHDVLRHRIGLTYEAEANEITTDDVINEILNTVDVP